MNCLLCFIKVNVKNYLVIQINIKKNKKVFIYYKE